MPNYPEPAAPSPRAAPATAGSEPADAGSASLFPLVVLANDPAMLLVLKQAVEARVRIWRADDELHAADLVMAGNSGILFIDVAVTREQTAALVERLHGQLPDLPIIVTGRRDDEAELGALISSGAVFRFLHKPVSPERVRNFVEGAIRRRAASPGMSAEAARPEAVRERPVRRPLDPAARGRLLKALALVAVLAVAGLALAQLFAARPWEDISLPTLPTPAANDPVAEPDVAAPPPAPRPARRDDAIDRLLQLAAAALVDGRLTEPGGENAIELYRAVLAVEPDNAAAHAGLAGTADALVARTREALAGGDLAAAASALDAARGADPAHVDLRLLSAELAAARERAATAQASARESAIEDARDAAIGDRVAGLVALAEQRLQQNRLVGGADSALAYVTAARQSRPGDPAVRRVTEDLSDRLLANARQAERSGDLAAAAKWVDQAVPLGANPAALAAIRASLPASQLPSDGEDRARLLALANQRIAQGRLLDPPADSASHYLDLLRAAEADYEGLAETTALFAGRVLDEGRRLTRDGRYPEAERALNSAAASGASASALAEARRQLDVARQRAAAAREVLPESALSKIAHTPAKYPHRAVQREVEGWVDVQFTVATDGSTRDPRIVAAEPAGIFDEAVLEAVSKWRYRPHIVAGGPVDQRIAVRVRFELAD